jgi:oligoribonuclease (3'-5' exoribonuclease)
MTEGGPASVTLDFLNKIRRWNVTNNCLYVNLMSVVFKERTRARGLLLFIGEQLAASKNALCGNNISRDAALCTMELAC